MTSYDQNRVGKYLCDHLKDHCDKNGVLDPYELCAWATLEFNLEKDTWLALWKQAGRVIDRATKRGVLMPTHEV